MPPDMKTLSAVANISAALLGGLFEPSYRRFGGLGEAVSAALTALDGQRMIAIQRIGSDNFGLRMIPAADEASVREGMATAFTTGDAMKITSSLPTGGAKRYAYAAEDFNITTPMPGPLAAGVYSLADFLDQMADGGFAPELEADMTAITAFGPGQFLVLDQGEGDIWLTKTSGAGHAAVVASVDANEVTLEAQSAKWE